MSTPRFQFLPPSVLEENFYYLARAVIQKHYDKDEAVPEVREAHLQLLDETIAITKKFTSRTSVEYQSQLDKVKETFEITTDLLNAIDLTTDDAEKTEKSALRDRVTARRQTLRDEFSRILMLRKTDRKEWMHLTALRRSQIITGAYLTVLNAIDLEYSGFLNAVAGLIVRNESTNSELRSGIPAAIGVTPENVLDEKSKKEALAAYASYQALRPDVMPAVADENEKTIDVSPLNTAKLKKSESVKSSYAQILGVIRDATPAEAFAPYNAETKKYSVDDRRKVQAMWKGVPEPVVEIVEHAQPSSSVDTSKVNVADPLALDVASSSPSRMSM